MTIAEALQQVSDNQHYILGLLNQLKMGTIHPDSFAGELTEVVALNQECIEILSTALECAIDF